MSENRKLRNDPKVVAKHVRIISHYEGITEGQASVLIVAADLLEQAEATVARVQELLDHADENAAREPYDLLDNLWRDALGRALHTTGEEDDK